MPKLFINLNEIKEDGKDFAGELRQDIFALPADSAEPHSIAPVQYDLHVGLEKDLVVVTGTLTTAFELVCSRCGEKFAWPLEITDYDSAEPREGRSNLDLTELIREDILLTLPGYPHCEDSPVIPPLKCPAADKFVDSSKFMPISDEDATRDRSSDAWGILDELTARKDKKKP